MLYLFLQADTIAAETTQKAVPIIEILLTQTGWFFLIPLLLMSFIAVYIFFERFVKIQKANDIDNDFISQKLYIYPNPNYKIFYVKSILEVNSIKILDILGKTVEFLNPNKKLVEIDISENPSGIYFLKINLSSGSTFTKKIVCK